MNQGRIWWGLLKITTCDRTWTKVKGNQCFIIFDRVHHVRCIRVVKFLFVQATNDSGTRRATTHFPKVTQELKNDHQRKMSETNPTQLQKVGSASFYGLSSILIVFINKSVLSINHFPSANVLGIGQMVTAIVVLGIHGLKFNLKVAFENLKSKNGNENDNDSSNL